MVIGEWMGLAGCWIRHCHGISIGDATWIAGSAELLLSVRLLLPARLLQQLGLGLGIRTEAGLGDETDVLDPTLTAGGGVWLRLGQR